MPLINVDGIKTNYITISEFQKSLPTVILLHGACQSIWCWKFQTTFFENYKRFNSIAVDLPGHGKSSGDGFSSINEYSDFLNSFIQHLGLEDIILLGHSMGGRISQVFALDYPEKVAGCILVGTGARLKVTQSTFNLIEKGFKSFAGVASKNSFSNNFPEELREEFYNKLMNANKTSCMNDMIACNEFDVEDDVSKIEIPSLIIAAENDILAPVKYSRKLNESIKGSRLDILGDSGHFMMLEKPDEFNSLLKEFLDIL